MLLSKGMSESSSILPAMLRSMSSIPNSQHQADSGSSLRRAAQSAMNKPLTAGYSSSTEVATTPEGENSWSKWRAPYGLEQKSSLGTAMYLSIAVFGFSMYLNDVIYHPPRVVTMLGLMMLLLYVRRK